MAVDQKYAFGCTLRDVTAQFGLNQNPSIFTYNLVQESGQDFSLSSFPQKGIRSLVPYTLGGLDLTGLVQGWDKTEVDIAGRDTYSVRISDTKPVLEAACLLFYGPQTGLDTFVPGLGANVISVVTQDAADIELGLPYASIKTAVEAATVLYGSTRFRVDLSHFLSAAPMANYRLQGGAMTIGEFIQQVAEDHGIDWYVLTTGTTIHVHGIRRDTTEGLALETLATYGVDLIHRSRGYENRDVTNRIVLLGAQQQRLVEMDGGLWRQFWGFNDNGEPLTQATCRINFSDGTSRTVTISEETQLRILNDTVAQGEMSEESWGAVRGYLSEYMGRQFYHEIEPVHVSRSTPGSIEPDSQPWIEPVHAGWWNSDVAPASLTPQQHRRLRTEDGRWIAFIKLWPEDPWIWNNQGYGSAGWKYNEYVRMSPNTMICDKGIFMGVNVSMECSKDKWYLVMTVPVPLGIFKRLEPSEVDGSQIIAQGLVTRPDGSQYYRTVYNLVQRHMALGFEHAWVALADRRCYYGPWTNTNTVSIAGKTKVVIDSSLTPWTFASGTSLPSVADRTMDEVANAKVKSLTVGSTTIATGRVEAAGLPTCGLGTVLDGGAPLTQISVHFGVDRIVTSYQAQQFTGELGRYQKMYQDMIDNLRREVRFRNNTIHGPANYSIMDKELQAFLKSLPTKDTAQQWLEGKDASAATRSSFGAIEGMTGNSTPLYTVRLWEEVVSAGRLTRRATSERLTNVWNVGELSDQAGRVRPGTFVAIEDRTVGTQTAKVINQAPDPPPQFHGYVIGPGSPSPMGPTYHVEPISTDADRINGILTTAEKNALHSVLNTAEPTSSPGHLRDGELVVVNWQDTGTAFVPFISHTVQVFYEGAGAQA